MKKFDSKLLWLVLVIGTVTCLFSSSTSNVALFAFVWPLCFVLFNRHFSKKCLGTVISFLAYCVVVNIKFYNALGTGILTVALTVNTIYAVITYLPFILDRILYGKINGKLGILVLPLAVAAVELFISLINFTMMENLAYTQTANLVFIQIADIIGTFGLSAFIAAFSTVAAYAIEKGFVWADVKKPVVIYLVLILIVNVYGGVKLAANDDYGKESVKVAMALGPELELVDGEWVNVSYDKNVASLKKTFAEAVGLGAEIVAYNEEAFCVADVERNDLIAEIKDLAAENNVFALVPIETYSTEDGLGTNGLVFISNEGEILADYEKSFLVPVIETSYYVKGDGKLPVVEINVNGKPVKVAMDICYDGDFSQYIRTMDNDVDIWFEPCWEWEPVYQYHTTGHFLR
ncbi:MAG: hypothetical protein HUJ66_07245, partial [Oscillospiraceae bacterium]|nr:hypothetical protein [Oscillospiraceae bacterium]